jgi:hypothetical protein
LIIPLDAIWKPMGDMVLSMVIGKWEGEKRKGPRLNFQKIAFGILVIFTFIPFPRLATEKKVGGRRKEEGEDEGRDQG